MQLWRLASARSFVKPQSMIVARVLNFGVLLRINEICLCLQEKKIISNCEGVEKTEGEKKVMYKEGQEPASVNKDDLPC